MDYEELRIVGGDIVALVQHVELNENGWVDSATAKGVRFLYWLLDTPADCDEIYAERATIGLTTLTQAQVSQAISHLISDGSLIPSGTKFKLSEEARVKVSGIVSAAEATEQNVIEKVITSARGATNSSDIDSSQLWSRFRTEFIIPFIQEFGARAYELITGQATNVGQKAFIAEFLSAFDQSKKSILEAMILSLLDKNNADCREYILGLLNTHFYQTSVALPIGVVDKVFPSGGKNNRLRILLDTNFIFSLFNLHSNPSNEAVSLLAQTIAKLPSNIDVRMYVLPATLLEFRKALIHYEGIAKNFRLTQNLVEGALDFGVSGILETYFKRVKASGYKITADDYFRPFHESIVTLLKQHNVSVLSGEDEKYNQHQPTIDDALDQDIFYKNKASSEKKRSKSYEQIWHDVLLWHFTSDRRPTIADTIFEAEWVGTTIDYGLLAFDRFKRHGKGVPVIVHPASLVQALQLLVPSDENLEKTILALMQMPFLFETFDPANEKITQKILSTISRFDSVDDLSPDTIIQLLGNRALRGKIEVSASRDQEVELIRDAIVDHAAETEKRAIEAEQKLAEIEKVQNKTQTLLRANEEAYKNEKYTYIIEKSEFEKDNKVLEKENEELKQKIKKLEISNNIAEEKKIEARKFNVATTISVSSIIFFIFFVYIYREYITKIAWWTPWVVGLLIVTTSIVILEFISRKWTLLSDYWVAQIVKKLSYRLKSFVVFLVLAVFSPLLWDLVKEDINKGMGTMEMLFQDKADTKNM